MTCRCRDNERYWRDNVENEAQSIEWMKLCVIFNKPQLISLAHHKNYDNQYFAISYHICYYGIEHFKAENVSHGNLCAHAFRTFRFGQMFKCSNVNNNREHREHRTLNSHILLYFMSILYMCSFGKRLH